MKCLNKAFLFSVGVITIAYDEVVKKVQRVLDEIQEERNKMGKQVEKKQV